MEGGLEPRERKEDGKAVTEADEFDEEGEGWECWWVITCGPVSQCQ